MRGTQRASFRDAVTHSRAFPQASVNPLRGREVNPSDEPSPSLDSVGVNPSEGRRRRAITSLRELSWLFGPDGDDELVVPARRK